jgi:ubiquinone/menaquinone biosynthesis C-methylase UbiE
MQDAQRDFYNAAYPLADYHPAQLPSLLRAFEIHRTDVALQLLPPGRRLLDIGCGDGDLLMRAAPRFERVVGLELADTQLTKARKRIGYSGLRNVSLVQANVDTGLPFQNAQFDAISLVAVLAFVFDPIALLSEASRVLKADGQMIVEVLNLGYAPRRFAVLSGRLPGYTSCRGWEGGHLHNFTRRSLANFLRSSGFDVLQTTGSGTFAALRSWWPAMLLGNVIVQARKR